jgi:sec-independent protein translocase protein TatA
MFGTTELIIIVLIIVILFGAKSLPKLARSIGEARKELQKGLDDESKKDTKTNDEIKD